ncbi:ATP-binding protein [Saccharopolyspora erythraea]|uniref:ATP-binding protein n=1 Tax=Saccharopolyspora erythraea TaxID=1836 RepID=UPI001BA76C23|nr:ATP-binding protein [Saccharopolyspora erythraea]QUH02634.1 ATP-binding protein [Saccharopolyspora erythraea]
MNAQTAQVDDLRLLAVPSAVNCTDLFVRFALAEWSLRPLVPEAVEVANQIVTAAVDVADPNSPGFITIRLRLTGECLVIEVEDDPLGEAPQLAYQRSGVEYLRDGRRMVWCQLGLPTGVKANEVPLPRREKKRSYVSEDETAEVDPEVISRLLTGLNRSTEQ